MFDELPDGCIAHVVRQLRSVQDIHRFGLTCKRHALVALSDQSAWLGMLREEFDIRLQVRYLHRSDTTAV